MFSCCQVVMCVAVDCVFRPARLVETTIMVGETAAMKSWPADVMLP